MEQVKQPVNPTMETSESKPGILKVSSRRSSGFAMTADIPARREPVLAGVKKPPAGVKNSPAGDKKSPVGDKKSPDRSTRKASVNCQLKNLVWLLALLGFLQMMWWAYMAGTLQAEVANAGERIQVQAEVANAGETIQVQAEVGNAEKKESDGEIGIPEGKTIQVQAEVSNAGETIQVQAEVGNAERKESDSEIGIPESKSAATSKACECVPVSDELVKLMKLIEGIRKIWGIAKNGTNGLDKMREKGTEKPESYGIDYASGGWIVRHSDAYYNGLGGTSIWTSSIFGKSVGSKKLLTPSSRVPEDCFEFLGRTGFVIIELRSPVIVEAVTIEHLAEGGVFRRMSAPKHCKVSGWVPGWPWRRTQILLTEFTYDRWKENAQTFKVLDSAASAIVDSVRLDFTSNHGWSRYTSICGIRVHGREPNSTVS